MDFHTEPAANYALPDLIKFLNQSFEDYFVPVQFNTASFLNMLRKDGLDLSASSVLIHEDQPCGIAFIARRGWTSRLAAMGIDKGTRGKGAGSWFMDKLIEHARQRGDREMVLEVIEQNEAAVRLYQKYGFQIVRRLIGLLRGHAEENGPGRLHDMDLREVSRLVSQYGLSDLPWQLSAESLAQMNPPARAYRNERAYIVVSNPEAEHVMIWSLLVEPEARGNGHGTEILKRAIAQHPGKTWHVPAVFPQELGKVFERADFELEQLSQWQMKLKL